MTSAEQITQLINSGNTWLERTDQLAADREAHEAGYAALAGNLTGIVGDQMHFVATVDPNDPNPTNVEGGIFNTIAEAINASPAGSAVQIKLAAGSQHVVSGVIALLGRDVLFTREGAGVNPAVTFAAYVANGLNLLGGFSPYLGGSCRFFSCDLAMTAKSDIGLAWGVESTIMRFSHAARSFIGVTSGTISGVDGRALASAAFGTNVSLALNAAVLDGPILAVHTAGHGTVNLSQFNVTLSNGAALHDAGTVGTNILQN